MDAVAGAARDKGEHVMPETDHAPRRLSEFDGFDPYLDWVLGPGSEDYFPEGQREWLTVLLRLDGVSPADFANGSRLIRGARAIRAWQDSIWIPAIHEKRALLPNQQISCTAFVKRAFFASLAANESLRKPVVRLTLSLPLDEHATAFFGAGAARRKRRRQPDRPGRKSRGRKKRPAGKAQS